MRYVILLCLAACASPAPREYRDGPMPTRAPVFVAPGYTPAGAGLHEYLPGAPEPAVERSPHRRVLPPTKEPTVFSGDRPRAAAEAWPSILGVPLPLPPNSQDLPREVATLKMCADEAPKAIARAQVDLSALRKDEARCLAARLHLHCVEQALATISVTSPEHAGTIGAVRDAAVRLFYEQCPDPANTERVKALASDVADAWAPLRRIH